MSTVELYRGEEVEEESEILVLQYLKDYFSKRGIQATLIASITIKGSQIDILVATDSHTYQIEVKNYTKNYLCAFENGDWYAYENSGDARSIYPNGYQQTRKNGRLIKDCTAKWMSRDKRYPFPQGVLLFTPKILDGFEFNDDLRNDLSVIICDLTELDEVLSRKSTRVPWTRTQVREFIRRRNLTYCERIEDLRGKPKTAKKEADIGAQREHKEIAREVEILVPRTLVQRAAYPMRTSRSAAERSIEIAVINKIKEPPSPRRYLKILTASTLAMAILAAGNFFWNKQQPATQKVTEVSRDHKPEEKLATTKPARPRNHASDASRLPLPPKAPEGQVIEVSQRGRPPAPINCPANIDRLGCNGRVGVFDAPQCPAHFHVDGESCAPD